MRSVRYIHKNRSGGPLRSPEMTRLPPASRWMLAVNHPMGQNSTEEQVGVSLATTTVTVQEFHDLKYPWKRFWCPREGALNLSDGGFLYDPEGKYARLVGSDVVPFEGISHLPCLAMLGEPGIGKSTAISDLRESVERAIEATEDKLFYVNLNEYGDENRLIQDLFGAETFTTWATGRHILHMFLDSLDECRLRIPQVAAIVVNRLQRIGSAIGRLRLRIACRTADWPATFEGSFSGLWGEGMYGAYELAPLRRQDVEMAAQAQGLDAERFFAELNRTETVPLAIKPITLGFLLGAFNDHQRLPTTRNDLYESGCRILCEEANPLRQGLRAHGGTGYLSAQERLTVASRIAAVSIFCRKPTIVTFVPDGRTSSDEVSVASLAGGEEKMDAGCVEVSEDAVHEVLGTGLFSSRGAYRMGFAHQTYAEFLASRYLLKHGVSTRTILALLRHPDDPVGVAVPQLYETAGWVVGMDKNILRALVAADPQVLLRGDAATLTEEERRLIIDSLLQALSDRRANDRDWNLHRHYPKLKHAGLVDQLRPWIEDRTRFYVARDAAIDIAAACGSQDLQGLLADLALDETEFLRLRDSAARTVADVADPETRRRLMPLALGKGGDDPQDELKGDAIRGLWPGVISAEELFGCLTLPKKDNFGGSYSYFLNYELASHLGVADLPYALDWLRTLVRQKRLGFSLHRIADAITVKAWENACTPSVLDGLAALGLECLTNHRGLIQNDDTWKEHKQVFDDPTRRRLLAAKIIPLCRDRDIRFGITGRSPRLIRIEDFDWCVGQLLESVGGETEATWAEIVWGMLFWGEPDSHRLDSAIAARARSPIFRSTSDLFFTPVELGSERAGKMKEEHDTMTAPREEAEPPLLEPSPQKRIEHWLARSEDGGPATWSELLYAMTLKERGTHYGSVPLDVRRLPGWENAEEGTRKRMLVAADRFLREGPVDPLKWEREPHSWKPIHHAAPYAALLLLKNEAPDLFDALPGWVWERHVATVLCLPFNEQEATEKQALEEIALKCFRLAKRAFLFYLPLQLDAEAGYCENQHISCDGKLGKCWDDELCRTVHEKLVGAMDYWHTRAFEHVALRLMDQQHGPTKELMVALVEEVVSGMCARRAHAIIAGKCLITHTPDAAWPTVWAAIRKDREYGRELLMDVASEFHHNAEKVALRLTEAQLADLYLWLVREFPYSQDREHTGTYSPTRDDSVRDLRDGVLRVLEHRGTLASVQAVQRVAAVLPELDWLSSVVVETRKHALRSTWQPCTPADLLELTRRPKTGLVRSANELQEVLLEAICALQQQLQGETPAAPDLWDKVPRSQRHKKFRPKEEEHFSDWLKRHLKAELGARGIVGAREVEIRPGAGSGTGEVTDIHVTAIVPGLTDNSFNQVQVIIEVKGCWHRELKTAMKTQLVDRYLKDNQCQHGIYLVGWFVCDRWDKTDSRVSTVRFGSLDGTRDFLERQAKDLSQGGLSIRSAVINAALR